MRRRGYRLRLRWPIARGLFYPNNGDEMRGCMGFVKPWWWAIDWSVPRPRIVVDMGEIPMLDDDPTAMYDLLREMRLERGHE